MPVAEDIKILVVDSSSLTGSVALGRGETLVAESLLNVHSTHSEKLLQQVDLLLAESGWSLADLDLLAAVTGPGSFTGLRIGIATVKGLDQVLRKPVVSISSLQAVAMNLPVCGIPVCAFLDARKKEVYCQVFEWHADGPVAIEAARVLPPEQLLRKLQGPIALVGDGVPLYRNTIDRFLADRALIPPAPAHQLRASAAAWLALQAWRRGRVQDASEMLPIYIRPSDAEMNLTAKQCVQPQG